MKKNDILVVYGDQIKQMTKMLLEASKIEELIGDRHKKIGLKPNLILSKPASSGATTHPEIVAATIEYLQSKGFEDITIMEGSWIGDVTSRAFNVCGMNEVARKYNVPIVDTQKDTYHTYNCAGLNLSICDAAMNVDFMINMPVMKGHCQTVVTCALKNMKGIIPNKEKRHFHTMGLHKPIAHLNTKVHHEFILVDAICGDLDFEEGGNPVPMNQMFAMRDPVLCDAYACEVMGHDIEDVDYIGIAEDLGVGCADISKANIIELNKPAASRNLKLSRRIDRLARKANAQDACSACYASLIHALARMDEMGALDDLNEKVCIGQGFKGKTGKLGVGACTCKFDRYVKGCPAKGSDILDFLMDEVE